MIPTLNIEIKRSKVPTSYYVMFLISLLPVDNSFLQSFSTIRLKLNVLLNS